MPIHFLLRVGNKAVAAIKSLSDSCKAVNNKMISAQVCANSSQQARGALGTGGRSTFRCILGPLGWGNKKKTLTIILSSPKVDVLHSSDISAPASQCI